MTTAAFSANLKPRLKALTAVKREHCAPPTYKPAQDIRGKMVCPKCGGTLTFFVRAVNGLSSGSCSSTCMWRAGIPIESIQMLCGHEDKSTTEIYVKQRWSQAAEPNRVVMA